MSADFTPNKENLKIIPPFKMQVLTNFPYIEADFDALTNYQLLCKIVEYLNKVIHNENEVTAEVTGLYNAYVALQNYVNNYFDNLDVQEEINNKLDEMAESGQLTDIIAQYLGLAGMITYNTVAEMKLAQNLVNGSKCQTLGFYSYNDGGGAIYKVRTITNDDVIDNKTIIELYDNTLIAELIKNPEMSVKQFGAYGDGSHDDTIAINTAINYSNSIIIPNGIYMIEPAKQLTDNNINEGIKIPSNKVINLEENAILQCKTNNYDRYQVVRVNTANNVTINGGHIYGDKLTHTGSSSQHDCCLYIYTSNNVNVTNCEIAYAYGDSITIASDDGEDATKNCKNIYIDNCNIHDSRRNGISLISTENVKILNSNIYNISGTDPQNAIDIEANFDTNPVKDVIIQNCNLHDTTNASITITQKSENVTLSNTTLSSLNNLNTSKNVHINDCHFITEANHSYSIYNKSNDIHVNNCIMENNIQNDTNNTEINISNSIIKGKILAPATDSQTSRFNIENCKILFNGSTSLFVLRSNTYMKINNTYIESNTALNTTLGKELYVTNSIINNKTADINGFKASKIVFKNNVVKGLKYYLLLSIGETTEATYVTDNQFDTKPDLCISGSGTITQKIYVANNVSISPLTIKPGTFTPTNLITSNNIPE